MEVPPNASCAFAVRRPRIRPPPSAAPPSVLCGSVFHPLPSAFACSASPVLVESRCKCVLVSGLRVSNFFFACGDDCGFVSSVFFSSIDSKKANRCILKKYVHKDGEGEKIYEEQRKERQPW
ncbi:unnamed protein product [Cuscuta epithymum]|uniref:Uncharacterized protein n=1 Tax=Cuscuta epithymum TaxID=186058 RepID=A0AAV0GHB1_9ASTE|nr:unnamed protein product [Cuscuta epithymum]CAH9147322.1 unnamed protein product [Cuscuta epithymum]